jgi:hypothetical protein
MDLVPTCSICGVEHEIAHHVIINFTKAKALRQRLRKEWLLPPFLRLHRKRFDPNLAKPGQTPSPLVENVAPEKQHLVRGW